MVQAGWDDVPHLSENAKRELLDSTPPYLRDARSKGIPALGSGAIYPIPEAEITVMPFLIPDYWPRSYAMDVGWNRTACLWRAWDPSTGQCFIYAEHYMGQAIPSVHADAIKARGEWVQGVIDPAAHGRGQKDGEQLIAIYRGLGLSVSPANNAVDPGIDRCWTALGTGRLKVFANLSSFFGEYRLYRRDADGKVVKKNDHLMDCMRYGEMSGKQVAHVRPVASRSGTPISDNVAGY
jgi:hypothetical protein